MGESTNGKVNEPNDDGSDMEELEAQLNEIEHALDNLESQNENIHSKLKELLESNREVRKEMANLGLEKDKKDHNESKSSRKTPITSEMSQLEKMHNLSLGADYDTKSTHGANSSRSTKSKK